jgi:hypothetical protein
MRIGILLIVVWISLFAEPVSNGQQTLPGLGTRNTKPLPPVVVEQTQVEPGSPERSRRESLSTLDRLLNEARALQRELNETSERTVSAVSLADFSARTLASYQVQPTTSLGGSFPHC